MKRIIIALAVLLSVQTAQAEVKSPTEALKGVESAKAAAEKKPDVAKGWIKLGKAYVAAYDSPKGNAEINFRQADLKLLNPDLKVVSSETVTLGGRQFEKESYERVDYYYNENKVLVLIDVTVPVVEGALDQALAAYAKANELDPDGKCSKDLCKNLSEVAEKFKDEAFTKYQLGDYAASSKAFEGSASASASAPLNVMDTMSVYNAGYTAWLAKDYERAAGFYETAIANAYYGDGDSFAKLADCQEKIGKKDEAKATLEAAFAQFPQSQAVLLSLINFYLQNKEDPSQLFVLIEAAKKNEPNNASLYYVEGNINKQLGKFDEALAAYRQCTEINPDYIYGYIGAGQLLYDEAFKVQEQAGTELNDAKYNALIEKRDQLFRDCIPPFETAFEKATDPVIKRSLAEYLKSACYRFKSMEDPELGPKYDKYAAYVAENS